MINNPYIEKVINHKNILNSTDEIYKYKWKWKKNYFGNNNDLILEIWTWLWNFFSKEVQNNPDKNFIWMEIKYKRLYICAEKALGHLNNYTSSVRLKWAINKNNSNNDLGEENKNFVMIKDFWENIDKIFDSQEVSKTYIFFPDPWAKKERQKKHRLLQEKFLNNLYEITKKNWIVIIKTDHLEYFNFILNQLEKTSWKIIKKSNDWENENEFRNEETTEFQQLFRWKNIKINYLELQK